MTWLRLDSNFRHHPKFLGAGFWGASAVLAAWEFAREYNRHDGKVTDFWTEERVSWWLGLGEDDASRLRHGMSQAVTCGLIECHGDDFFIHDWTVFQRRAADAERQQNHRDKINVTVASRPVTKCHLQNRTEHNKEYNSETAIPVSAAALALAEQMIEYQIKATPGHRLAVAANRSRAKHQYGKVFDAMMRLDARSAPQIASVLKWVWEDAPVGKNGFSWRTAIQGAKKFREKYDMIAGQMAGSRAVETPRPVVHAPVYEKPKEEERAKVREMMKDTLKQLKGNCQ